MHILRWRDKPVLLRPRYLINNEDRDLAVSIVTTWTLSTTQDPSLTLRGSMRLVDGRVHSLANSPEGALRFLVDL
jgi:hypothetical protein